MPWVKIQRNLLFRQAAQLLKPYSQPRSQQPRACQATVVLQALLIFLQWLSTSQGPPERLRVAGVQPDVAGFQGRVGTRDHSGLSHCAPLMAGIPGETVTWTSKIILGLYVLKSFDFLTLPRCICLMLDELCSSWKQALILTLFLRKA